MRWLTRFLSFRLSGVDGHLVGERAALRVCLDRAIASMYPVFQPIVDCAAQRVIAYEALMRCSEPMLPNPGAVLGAAERLDRLFDPGRVMRQRTAEAARALPPESDLFVNLHPEDLLDPELYDAHAPLTALAGRTVLELTERANLDHVKDVEGRVRMLRGLGFRIAIDDLGAGYAGLNSLVQLQPDIVKLDMVLTRLVDRDQQRRGVVGSLISLSNRLGMQVVCEGVETPGERDCLMELGGTWHQGFLYAHPGPATPTVSWI